MATEKHISDYLVEACAKRRENDYDAAKKLVDEAYQLCEEDDYDHLGRVFHIYMQFESDHHNYEDALKLEHRALAYYQKGEDTGKIAHAIRHVADLQSQLGRTKEAVENYEKAIKTYRSPESNSDMDLANALRGYAIALEKSGEKKDALKTWKEVKGLYGKYDIQEGVDEASHSIQKIKKILKSGA